MKLLRAKTVVAALALVMTVQTASAASADGPSSLKNTDVGTAVHVTFNTSDRFDGIWMGRDGDRAVFERTDSREMVAVRLDALKDVTRFGGSTEHPSEWGILGFFAGLFGSAFLIGSAARGRR